MKTDNIALLQAPIVIYLPLSFLNKDIIEQGAHNHKQININSYKCQGH